MLLPNLSVTSTRQVLAEGFSLSVCSGAWSSSDRIAGPKERRTAARDARRARGQSIGRPKALSDEKVALARRMHDSGESATTIATTLGVSRATVYRVLSEDVE